MRIVLITDTHFGHDKLIEYSGRPANHSKLILENFRSFVRTDDLIVHLGDFCIGNDEDWTRQFMQTSLNCLHILVKGNHDHKSDSWYYEHGWDFVCDEYTNKNFGKHILFSHEPRTRREGVDVNIHGHFHNNYHRAMEEGFKEMYDPNFHKKLAIEETDYKPVLLGKWLLSNPITRT